MELSFEDLKALVLLNSFEGRRKVLAALQAGAKPSAILDEFADKESKLDPNREIEKCQEKQIELVTWFDQDYPALLREIIDPPLVLYMKGDLIGEDENAVAIVGTRHPSAYGHLQCRRFAKSLSESGITIISGFAKGIDQIAHETALEISHGRTIAVLGCGLDIEYPYDSRELFKKVCERGAVLSEFPLGTHPRAENFPKRNRIISGLSLGVLVVEAAMRSGSLITAHEAIDQGREVFAIPGPVDRLTSHGTHALIREGAILVEHPAEIIEALALPLSRQINIQSNHEMDSLSQRSRPKQQIHFECSEIEKQLLRLIEDQPLGLEEICQKMDLSPDQLNTMITQLELQGKIKREWGGRLKAAAI